MRAVVHVAAGAALVAVLPNPIISLPLAFILHFALDTVPHFGDSRPDSQRVQLNRQKYQVPIDGFLCLLLLIAILLSRSNEALIVAVGGILCASPDLFHLPRFIRYLVTGNSARYDDAMSRFHEWIQWCERPWGWVIEVPFLAVMLVVLFNNL